MSHNRQTEKDINKRLAPLYITGFFHSFVLWYAIEKLFMQSIGFDNTGIGVMIAVYSAVMLVVEIPSGILADRWSRKGVLMIASVCLALSGLIGGVSHGVGLYLIGSVLWGVFFACYSGMYDSIIYDTIAETAPKSKLFDRLYGRMQQFESLALIIGSIAGAALAAAWSPRAVYFITVPLSLLPILILWRFKEPTLHKQHAVIPVGQQIKATLRAITRNRALLPVIIALIIRSTLIYCVYEFAQLWLLALHTPTAYYGIANAVLLASIGAGGILVSRFQLGRYSRMLFTLAAMLLGSIGLIMSRNVTATVTAQFVFATCLICIYIVFSRILHDNLSASVRAGASSATSTMARILIIPVALLLGYFSQTYSIYVAAYILLGLALVMTFFVVSVARQNNRTGLDYKAS